MPNFWIFSTIGQVWDFYHKPSIICPSPICHSSCHSLSFPHRLSMCDQINRNGFVQATGVAHLVLEHCWHQIQSSFTVNFLYQKRQLPISSQQKVVPHQMSHPVECNYQPEGQSSKMITCTFWEKENCIIVMRWQLSCGGFDVKLAEQKL